MAEPWARAPFVPAGAARELPVSGRVRVLGGVSWLAVDGELADIVLPLGDSCCFERGRRLLACAPGGPGTNLVERLAPVTAPREADGAAARRAPGQRHSPGLTAT